MSNIVWKEYRGEIPKDIDLLVKLPGVGRKTANVVLGNIFNQPALVVDTHVTRITNLLKFVKTKNAVKIEMELCNTCQKRITKNALRLFDCKNPHCQELLDQHAPLIFDSISDDDQVHFKVSTESYLVYG